MEPNHDTSFRDLFTQVDAEHHPLAADSRKEEQDPSHEQNPGSEEQ
jgi:hypothetical protein